MRYLAILLAGGAMLMHAEGTRLEHLRQPPFSTTLMGVLKGAADYYGLNLDAPMMYGLSGHAFLINIHTQLCPSGPYCWKRENAAPLIEHLGIRMNDLGCFDHNATAAVRAKLERQLRAALDQGIPCSLLNLENQLISGHDATGFFCAQPWGPHQVTPSRLTCGSWAELGQECHVTFHTLEKVAPADRPAAVLASLDYALDLWQNPLRHSSAAYGAGPNAYDNWIAAVPAAGATHGNWWNAVVWSECRQMAAAYFVAIGNANKRVADLCAQLNAAYLTIAGNLQKASDKALASEKKIALLRETKHLEAEAMKKVQQLASALRAQQKR